MTAKAKTNTNKTNKTNGGSKVKDQTNYRAAVKTAKAASNRAGAVAWIIGDLAAGIVTEYGENKIRQFADDISQEVGTVRNWRTMAVRFPAGDGHIARDLQHTTVYGIFTADHMTDRDALIKFGQIDGQPASEDKPGKRWSVSQARKLVTARKNALNGPQDPPAPSPEDGPAEDAPVADELDTAMAEVDRIYGELIKAIAKANKIRSARGLAKLVKPAMPAPAEDKPAEDKPAEDKPAEDKPAEDKPAEVTAPAAVKCDVHGVTHRPGSAAAKRCQTAREDAPANAASAKVPATAPAATFIAPNTVTADAPSAMAVKLAGQTNVTAEDIPAHLNLALRVGVADHLRTVHGVTELPRKRQDQAKMHAEIHHNAIAAAKVDAPAA